MEHHFTVLLLLPSLVVSPGLIGTTGRYQSRETRVQGEFVLLEVLELETSEVVY